MQKYTVYLLINSSVGEVFFGVIEDLNLLSSRIPAEIQHWNLQKDYISNPVVIEEELVMDDAILLLADLQTKAQRNPQGKVILINKLASGESTK